MCNSRVYDSFGPEKKLRFGVGGERDRGRDRDVAEPKGTLQESSVTGGEPHLWSRPGSGLMLRCMAEMSSGNVCWLHEISM